ncbi:glycosyltransferase family 39 protein [Coprobacter tertius]|uniref:Glycosyltransferase family 39 protein n=1 Tax=Coprobacter tertius TaxID=2944915 RepID=A0ABT1MK54_9BACT|nr:glycosyltransferase family 39 protein [Coprobacter tertius]MCP9613010.1 glycosyltransferase family 39 protein [Coprobacter tertius]
MSSYLFLPVFFAVAYYTYKGWIKISRRTFIFNLFIVSLFIRICSVFILVTILNHYIGIPFLSYKDDYNYHNAALEILNRWKVFGMGFYSDIFFSTGSYSGFPNFSAFLMNIFGESIYVPRIGNAVVSSFTCVIAYKICRTYADESSSRLVGILFMVSPLVFVYSSLQLKDTLLLFFILLAIKANINLFYNRKILTSIILVSLSYFSMIFIRPATIVPIVGAYLLVYAYYSKRMKKSSTKIIFLILTITLLIYGWNYISNVGGIESTDVYFGSRLESMQTRTISSSDAKISNLGVAEILGAPLYLLMGIFLPSPLIVDLPDAETINYDSFAMVMHLSLLPLLVVAILYTLKYRKTMLVPMYILMIFILLKIGQANSLLTIFSPRQSLGTLMSMYLLLPVYFTGSRKIKLQRAVFALSILITIVYAGIRLYTRGLI